jgi:hypothetical protein
MDISLMLRVLRRFKLIVLGGLVLATLLAVYSTAKVDFKNGAPSFSYRSSEEWASYSRVLVTQKGFRWGSSLLGPESTPSQVESQSSAEGRLPTLATIYASFVTGDDVRRILLRSGKIRGKFDAVALPAGPNGGGILPIVSITSTGPTAIDAQRLGDRTTAALERYVDAQQAANDVPAAERIQLRVLNKAGQTKLIGPRSKTIPIAVFVAVMFAIFGLVLMLENLRPRMKRAFEADAGATERSPSDLRAAS